MKQTMPKGDAWSAFLHKLIRALEDVSQCGDISCDESSDEHESTSSSECEIWEDCDWGSDDSGDDPDW